MDPKLQEYLRQKYMAEQGVADAQKRQSYGEMAGAGLEAVGQAMAANNSDPQVLAQGWGKTDAPTVVGELSNTVNMDGLRKMGARGVANAKEGAAAADKSFWDQNKLGQQTRAEGIQDEDRTFKVEDRGIAAADRTRKQAREDVDNGYTDSQRGRTTASQAAEDDPNSEVSKMYQGLMAKVKPGHYAGLSATQLKAGINPAMDTYRIDEGIKIRGEAAMDRAEAKKTALEAKAEAAATKSEEKANLLTVPGYDRTGAVGIKPEEAVKLRDANANLDSLRKEITAYRDSIDKNGSFELGGAGGAQMESLSTSIRMRLKNLYELGALSGPDMAIIESQISSPTSVGNLFSRDSTVKAGLDQTLQSLERGVDSKMTGSGYKKAAFPRQVRNASGEMATVSNEAELQEAKAEGFQ